MIRPLLRPLLAPVPLLGQRGAIVPAPAVATVGTYATGLAATGVAGAPVHEAVSKVWPTHVCVNGQRLCGCIRNPALRGYPLPDIDAERHSLPGGVI